MTKHPALLFRAITTDDEGEESIFFALACCFTEAAAQVEAYCDEHDLVVCSVEVVDGSLIIEGDDDDEGDDAEIPPFVEPVVTAPVVKGSN